MSNHSNTNGRPCIENAYMIYTQNTSKNHAPIIMRMQIEAFFYGESMMIKSSVTPCHALIIHQRHALSMILCLSVLILLLFSIIYVPRMSFYSRIAIFQIILSDDDVICTKPNDFCVTPC
jgi:hypothetical protein